MQFRFIEVLALASVLIGPGAGCQQSAPTTSEYATARAELSKWLEDQPTP